MYTKFALKSRYYALEHTLNSAQTITKAHSHALNLDTSALRPSIISRVSPSRAAAGGCGDWTACVMCALCLWLDLELDHVSLLRSWGFYRRLYATQLRYKRQAQGRRRDGRRYSHYGTITRFVLRLSDCMAITRGPPHCSHGDFQFMKLHASPSWGLGR